MRLKRDDYLDNLSPLENNLAKLYRANLLVPLKGFCRVIEEGNLSNAAEKYGITAGLLTKQIKVTTIEENFSPNFITIKTPNFRNFIY